MFGSNCRDTEYGIHCLDPDKNRDFYVDRDNKMSISEDIQNHGWNCRANNGSVFCNTYMFS